jgi:hypothetical protein
MLFPEGIFFIPCRFPVSRLSWGGAPAFSFTAKRYVLGPYRGYGISSGEKIHLPDKFRHKTAGWIVVNIRGLSCLYDSAPVYYSDTLGVAMASS